MNRAQGEEPIEPGSPGPLSLRRRDQILIGVAAGFALISIAFYCLRTGGGGRYPIELDQQPDFAAQYRIDLNNATWVEWTQLPGIGQKLAKSIVEERAQHGPFRDAEDLKRVRGIGKQRIEAIRPFLRTEPSAQPGETTDASEAP